MKIEFDNRVIETAFGRIMIGDVFTYCGEVHMRIEDTCASGEWYNTVNLMTGTLDFFGSDKIICLDTAAKIVLSDI